MARVWRDRMAVLNHLGYPDYKAYLASERWDKIRGEVLAKDGHKCRCGKKATQVHHRRYDEATLLGETLDWMAAICSGCHLFGSIDERGKYTSPEEADRRIAARIAGVPVVSSRRKLPFKPFKRLPKKERHRLKLLARRLARVGGDTSVHDPRTGQWDVTGGASRRRS